MPLLSFEGVEVAVPMALQGEGIQFSFVNGALSIQCTNFTGAIVMTKPSATSVPMVSKAKAGLAMALSDFPTVQSTDSVSSMNFTNSPSSNSNDSAAHELIVQTTQTSTLSSLSSTSKKRSIPDEQDDPDVAMELDDSKHPTELLHKRARPNFLSDVEQSMLLAQLETSQQSSVPEASAEAVAATTTTPSLEAKSPENESSSPSDFKTPAKVKKAASVSHMKSFFSPEPKELASKKAAAAASESTAASKRGGATARATAAKAKASEPPITQVSIRDMMVQSTAPAVKAPSVQTPPRTATWSIVATTDAVPCERWGHTATAIAGNRVVVYGGADDDETTLGDLHVLDRATHAWSTPLNCESIPRAWHDAVHLAAKHLLLVFGGERALQATNQLDVLSDIMVLDTECFLWYPPAVSGTPPTARSGHACTVVGNDVVVFGGSRGRSRQSAVHVLDSDAWHWKQVKVEGKPPSARTYHSAVAVDDNSVVYFGGNDATTSFRSVHVLKKSVGKTHKDVWTWFHPCVVGTAPSARTGHSATLVDQHTILVFGGWDPQSSGGSDAAATNVFDDAFLLNTRTWEWEKLAVAPTATGATVPGRVGHRAVLGSDGKTVLLLGGQDATEQRLSVVHALTLSGVSASSETESSVPATQASS